MSVARIYKPARTAMQSGAAKTKQWALDYEPADPDCMAVRAGL